MKIHIMNTGKYVLWGTNKEFPLITSKIAKDIIQIFSIDITGLEYKKLIDTQESHLWNVLSSLARKYVGIALENKYKNATD